MAKRLKQNSRSAKLTSDQMDILLNFLEAHPQLTTTSAYGETRQSRMALWDEIAKDLNQIKGPKKRSNEWKDCWVNLKSTTKTLLSKKLLEFKTKGGREAYLNTLSDAQRRIAALIKMGSTLDVDCLRLTPSEGESTPSCSSLPDPVPIDHDYESQKGDKNDTHSDIDANSSNGDSSKEITSTPVPTSNRTQRSILKRQCTQSVSAKRIMNEVSDGDSYGKIDNEVLDRLNSTLDSLVTAVVKQNAMIGSLKNVIEAGMASNNIVMKGIQKSLEGNTQSNLLLAAALQQNY